MPVFIDFLFLTKLKARKEKEKNFCGTKVHRSITHWYQLSESSLKILEDFLTLFKPMDHLVDFYLFQVPPKFKDVSRVLKFAEAAKLGERFCFLYQE